MELYLLDSLLRRTEVVDRYDSLIWTERYAEAGDFELVISSTSRTRTLLTSGQLLALNQSNRVMKIESVEDKDDSEGRSLLSIKGPSLESILIDRAARNQLGPNAANFSWVITDTPGNVARKIFQDICVTGILDVNDIIPYITTGNMYPADTIPEPTSSVAITLTPDTVYSLIKQICDSYGLGFRLVRNLDTSQLFFNVYSGVDHTTKQTANPAVIFSQALGNLNDTSHLSSMTGYKNVAYVTGKNGTEVVYAEGYTGISGFDRRVLLVDASDVTLAAGTALTTELQRRGKEALAQALPFEGMDGTISQYTQFTYGIHYNLGDLVEIRNRDGVTTDMKVTEQIFASDDQGDRSYPTLTTSLFITPGSWYSGLGSHAWNDALGTWAAPS